MPGLPLRTANQPLGGSGSNSDNNLLVFGSESELLMGAGALIRVKFWWMKSTELVGTPENYDFFAAADLSAGKAA